MEPQSNSESSTENQAESGTSQTARNRTTPEGPSDRGAMTAFFETMEAIFCCFGNSSN
ncbi:hypothetical protein PM082_023447 [Marasmius tenuissimus]|nr:hypothetical protein PM082_023447 [Marasmius tenuissimus]